MEVHLSDRMKAILASPNARQEIAAAFGRIVVIPRQAVEISQDRTARTAETVPADREERRAAG